MREIYRGIKFEVVRLPQAKIKDLRIEELIQAGKELAAKGFCPENSGNLSFRVTGGFIITRAGSELGKLVAEDFVLVTNVDIEGEKVFAAGKVEPSSEAMMHFLIYQARPDVSVILHAHALDLKDAIVTKKAYPYGTLDFARSAVEVLASRDLVILKEHGFVAVGHSVREALDKIES